MFLAALGQRLACMSAYVHTCVSSHLSDRWGAVPDEVIDQRTVVDEGDHKHND